MDNTNKILQRTAGTYPAGTYTLLTPPIYDHEITSIFVVSSGQVNFAIDNVEFLIITGNQQRTQLSVLIPTTKSLQITTTASAQVTINHFKIVRV